VEVLIMRARTSLLSLLLVLAATGCIKIDEWEKYNKAPGERCTSADECAACPEGIDWTCDGPTGDVGICPTREATVEGESGPMGVCRGSTGEPGMNCSGERPDLCDHDYCVYAGAAERGICSKVCDDGVCPDARFICTQTNLQSGGVANWCAQRCSADYECDSNAVCKSNAGTMVCFPN
jgi:hypothetical protein